jgi:hypothetical protein
MTTTTTAQAFKVHSTDMWMNPRPIFETTDLAAAERVMRTAHQYGGQAWIQYPEGF